MGEKKPNGFGLHDTLGNVWEWVEDWYAEDYYSRSPESDPNGPATGEYRVARGGSWRGIVRGLARVSSRYCLKPNVRSIVVGFRRCASDARVNDRLQFFGRTPEVILFVLRSLHGDASRERPVASAEARHALDGGMLAGG